MNERNNAATENDVNPIEGRTGLTSRELANATFRIKQRKLSSKLILENDIEPLVNAGYIDKIQNEEDRRSYLFYPVLNAKQIRIVGSYRYYRR
jgi:DNA-binding MarR family transcriptional regulator